MKAYARGLPAYRGLLILSANGPVLDVSEDNWHGTVNLPRATCRGPVSEVTPKAPSFDLVPWNLGLGSATKTSRRAAAAQAQDGVSVSGRLAVPRGSPMIKAS